MPIIPDQDSNPPFLFAAVRDSTWLSYTELPLLPPVIATESENQNDSIIAIAQLLS
jgi:hypothetical protein